jgi:hypothetical protein
VAQSRNNYSRPYYHAGFTGWFRGLFREVIPSSPGQVKGDWVTASLVSGVGIAKVTGDFTTASVATKSKFLVKE